MSHVQGVMRPIFDAPSLLFQTQPFLLVQLGLGLRRRHPGLMEFALGSDPAIDSSELKGSSQTEFFGFNGFGHDRPVFFTTASQARLLQ